MRVLVAGATGVLGRRAIPHLLRFGHEVVGLARNEERASLVRALGAAAAIGTLFDPASLARAAAGVDAVLHLATRIPTAPGTSAPYGRGKPISRC